MMMFMLLLLMMMVMMTTMTLVISMRLRCCDVVDVGMELNILLTIELVATTGGVFVMYL